MQRYRVGDVTFAYRDDLGGDVTIEHQQQVVSVPIDALVAFQGHCDALLECGAGALALRPRGSDVPCNRPSAACAHRDGRSCLIGAGLLAASASN